MKPNIRKTTWGWNAVSVLATGFLIAGCGSGGESGNGGATSDAGAAGGETTAQKLSGSIAADGSSTVGPITSAVAEEFKAVQPDVNVTVGVSGTGGGFKKFIAGETVIQDASRPIKEEEDKSMAAKKQQYIELPVAYDGLAVVVNPQNTWAECLTVEELKKIWEPNSTVKTWNQVNPKFPNKPIKLYGPDADSGTFDYFTDEINGEEGASRKDYTPSSDDNTLVQGVSTDPNAMGYFGLSFYEENKAKLKLVKIDAGDGCVEPTSDTVLKGTYKPLSRPLFIYVRRDAAEKPEVTEFVKFYLQNAKDLVGSVGYVPLPDELYQAGTQRFEARTVGTLYKDKAAKGKTLVELMGANGVTAAPVASTPQ